jgi:hypothetical protein
VQQGAAVRATDIGLIAHDDVVGSPGGRLDPLVANGLVRKGLGS